MVGGEVGKDPGGSGEGKLMIRMYYMKKILFSIKKRKRKRSSYGCGIQRIHSVKPIE